MNKIDFLFSYSKLTANCQYLLYEFKKCTTGIFYFWLSKKV